MKLAYLLLLFACQSAFSITTNQVDQLRNALQGIINYIDNSGGAGTNTVLWGFDGDIPRGNISISNEPAGPHDTPAFRIYYDCRTNDCDWVITEDGSTIYASLMYLNGQLPGRQNSPREWDMFCTTLRLRGTRIAFGQFDDNTAGGPGKSSHLLLQNQVPTSPQRPYGYTVPITFDTRGYGGLWSNPGIFTQWISTNRTAPTYRMVIASHIPYASSPNYAVMPSNSIPWAYFWYGYKTGLEVASNLWVNGKVTAGGYSAEGRNGITANIAIGSTMLRFNKGILTEAAN